MAFTQIFKKRLLFATLMSLSQVAASAKEWQPVDGHLLTRWAQALDPKKTWPEYPRPMIDQGLCAAVSPEVNANTAKNVGLIQFKETRYTLGGFDANDANDSVK